MRSVLYMCAILMLAFSSASRSAHLISDDNSKTEVVYFFSYHCSGCLALNQYITLYDEINKELDITRVPVFSENSKWQQGARLHVLLNTLPETRDLPSIQKSKLGFMIIGMISDSLESEVDYHNAFEAAGIDVSLSNFKLAWSELDVYLQGATYILEQAGKETKIKTPLVRVSKGGHVLWLSVNSAPENPGVDFIQRLNGAVK